MNSRMNQRSASRPFVDPADMIRTDKNFDMEQMNRSLEAIKRSGSSKKSHSATVVEHNEKQNGSAQQPQQQPPAPAKSAKYKKLWGKVGKHGMMQAAAAATTNADSSSSASSGGRGNDNKKKATSGWDQLLNPVLQKQRAREANYQHYHYQQVQLGEAVAGSGWTGANMECDCGEDSCPRCNLLLSMDDPTAQW